MKNQCGMKGRGGSWIKSRGGECGWCGAGMNSGVDLKGGGGLENQTTSKSRWHRGTKAGRRRKPQEGKSISLDMTWGGTLPRRRASQKGKKNKGLL